MKRNDRLLTATEQKLSEKAGELLTLAKTAEGEDRELTEDEQTSRETLRGEITELKAKAEELKGKIEIDREIETLASGLKGQAETHEIERQAPMSLGEQFVESDGYRAMIDRGLSGKWSSGMVDLHPASATLMEGASGGAAALVPEDRKPGVVPILYERLTVADLIASGQTNSNLIRYVVETVADMSAVGTVAEGADKPEVTLELDLVDEPVSKIAAFLPVSDETLEDAAQIRSYLDARLGLFVRIEEENQLLNGTGSGTDLDGILNRIPSGNKNQRATGSGTNDADHIFAAITTARESFLEPFGDRDPPGRLGRAPALEGFERRLHRRIALLERDGRSAHGDPLE